MFFSVLLRDACVQARSLQWQSWTVSSTGGNCCFPQELIKHFLTNLTLLNSPHRCLPPRACMSTAYFAKRTDFPYMLDKADRTWLCTCLAKKFLSPTQWWPRSAVSLQIDHHQRCGILPVPLNDHPQTPFIMRGGPTVPSGSHCKVKSNSNSKCRN